MPVDVRVRSRCCPDDFQHPLCRIGGGWTLVGSVALEVARHLMRILTNFAKVHRPATSGKEQQAVEALEEHSGRLMDCAEDGLSRILQFLHEIQNSPRGLGIQTRGRLVKEEKKVRLRGKLDTNGETLALLDVQTLTRDTDDGLYMGLVSTQTKCGSQR